jgi:hypothetical protein
MPNAGRQKSGFFNTIRRHETLPYVANAQIPAIRRRLGDAANRPERAFKGASMRGGKREKAVFG